MPRGYSLFCLVLCFSLLLACFIPLCARIWPFGSYRADAWIYREIVNRRFIVSNVFSLPPSPPSLALARCTNFFFASGGLSVSGGNDHVRKNPMCLQ